MKSEEVFSSSDKSENLGLGALIAAFPFLFFLPYLIKDKKYSPYCMFRANQSLSIVESSSMWLLAYL